MTGPTRAFSTPKSTGDQLTAAEANALDDGQFYAVSRNGDSTMLDDSTIELGAYDLNIINAGAGVGRFQPDADYTQFGGTGYPSFASARTVTDWVPPCGFSTNAPTIWTSAGLYWEATGSPNVSQFLYWALGLPAGIQITAAKTLVLNPSAGSLPTNMPVFTLLRRAVGATTTTSIGDVTDASGDVGTYNAAHALTISGLSHTVEHGYEYYLVLRNEYGGTSSTGLRAYRPYLTLSVSTLRAI